MTGRALRLSPPLPPPPPPPTNFVLLQRLSHFPCPSATVITTTASSAAAKSSSKRLRFSSGRGGGYIHPEDDDGGGGGGRRKRRWWWSEVDEMEDVDDDDDDDDDDDGDAAPGILELVIDNVWIFKVFKSLGYLLPFVLVSFLVEAGPKAFLMALAVPVGQSALFLAFKKLTGKDKRKTKPKVRRRRKSFTRYASDSRPEEKGEDKKAIRKKKMGFQSWVAGSGSSAGTSRGNVTSFGGWDELVDGAGAAPETSRVMSGSEKEEREKAKLGYNRGQEREEPLLLRLLVAVFPFLGSWTKMFW